MTEAEAYFIANLMAPEEDGPTKLGIGPVRAKRLCERFGSLDRAFVASESDLAGVKGIGRDTARKIRSWEGNVDAEKERHWAAELGLQIVTQADAAYPPALKEIYDPPLVLYLKGKIPETWPRGIGVVGSRETSHYGLETAK